MDIKERIKVLRKKHHLSQEEFAKKIGAKKRTVGSWEQGTRSVSSPHRKKICEAFNIAEAELFGGTSSKINPETLAALQDSAAVEGLLLIYKSNPNAKSTIKAFLKYIPNLSPEKRQALLTLCK